MKNTSYDVIVVGAGAAGLSAASALRRAGKEILVLEARDRLGGRVLTSHVPSLPVPIEYGAEFVHGLAPATLNLARHFHVPAVELDGGHWSLSDAGLEENADWEKVLTFLHGVREWAEAHPERDETFADYCTRVGCEPSLRTPVTAYVEGYHAADAAVIGVQSLARLDRAAERMEEDRAFRLRGGYGDLLGKLAGELEASSIRTGALVEAIAWSGQGVRVRGTFGEVRGKSAVVTLPVGVLRAGDVVFDPPLDGKENALDHLRMGHAVRVALRFDAPFWEGRAPGAAMFHAGVRAEEVTFPTWWTASPERSPHLVAWTGGPKARALRGLRLAELRERALRDLAVFFPEERAALSHRCEEAWAHDWTEDPFAKGAYSYAAVGGGDAHRALGEPSPPLFFAGEATDPEGDNGTVNGALVSGTRAAESLLAWIGQAR